MSTHDIRVEYHCQKTIIYKVYHVYVYLETQNVNTI